MNGNALRGLAVGLVASALSCSPAEQALPGSSRRVALPRSLVALVGSEEISQAQVARIAQAGRVSPAVARDRAVSDALFAVGARAAFEGGSIIAVVERAAWARALLESMKAKAADLGPSDAEVAELTALRWQDLDRPETVRTTHAVALVSGPVSDGKAKTIAQRIADAVRAVSDPVEFKRLAEAVPRDGVDVRVESLPAITVDGRSYYPENAPAEAASQRFDPDFARAANALSVGQTSEPVKSAFGYHVILCEARLPALRLPLDERRALLKDEIFKRRAEHEKQELLGRLTNSAPILITRSVEDLTARVRIAE